MDIRVFFQKVRETEAGISEPFVIVSSLATEDGGAGGVCREVSRAQAARLIVDKRARLATQDEIETYRETLGRMREEHERRCSAARVQVAILSEQELRSLAPRGKK